MLFIAMTLLGYISYKQLPVELLPNAELPMLYVQVSTQSEMDPSHIEQQAVLPLEGAISTIDGVENIESTVNSRQATLKVDFKKNVNFKITALKLQEKINETATGLPEGFVVRAQKIDMAMMASNFMQLQIRGSGGVDRVRNIVDKELRSELENIDGVASVNVYGGRQKAIEVQLNADACKALNITPSKISGLLTQNTQDKAFAGFVNDADSRHFVHVNSAYTHVSELENIVVAPGPVLLKDVATIFFDLKEETTLSRVNGKEAVSVSIINDSQANLIDLSHRVTETIDRLNDKCKPLDVEIVVQSNTAETMEKNINQIVELALVGGLLAIAVLWFFLKNIRLVFFIALSIPISIYAAFNFFYAFGISINSLTLVGMALAIGMLLDNSVVVLENIYRLSSAGSPPDKAITQGTKEVWRSIFAATLTTITVFLPFVFSDNMLIKLIGHHIGVSIISTLSISLLVALLFIPMVTYFILKGKKSEDNIFYQKLSIHQRPIQVYLVLLKACMRKPGVVVISAVILLFVIIAISVTKNVEQMKEVNSDRFNIYVTMPAGSTLDATDETIRILEERLDSIPEKKELIARIESKEAVITFVLKEDFRKFSKRPMSDIKSEVEKKVNNIPNVNITLSEAMAGNQSGGGMEGLGNFMRLLGIGDSRERIIIKGADNERMQLVAEDLRYYVDELEFINNTWVSSPNRQPEIRLNFDPILLSSYDISRANIASGLTALNSEISSGASLKIGEDTYEIIIRDLQPEPKEGEEEKEKKDKTTDDLQVIQIPNAKGGLHDLQSLASLNKNRGASQIRRVNQDKQIELFYNFTKVANASKELLDNYRSEIDQLIAGYNLPTGIAVEVIHEEDMFGDFKFLILAAFILIFMILASVFESVSTPFVLLFSIPLAAIGSLLALLLTSNGLMNANALTGFLILLGVVVNNGIILIDYANILRKRGYRRNRALMMAGLSRIRPILITSITTIVALLPLAMGDSEYAGAIGAPFAITVIGGLTCSTLLTLIFIPTVCIGLENTLQWYQSLSRKMWITHLIIFLAGVLCISIYTDGLLWQSIYLLALIAAIPGVTYFAQNSLRRAQSKLINPNEEIHIVISNLVKIYDWEPPFARQWKSGLKVRKRIGLISNYHKLKDFVNTIWQFLLWGFAIYFTYSFLQSRWWIFIFILTLYASTLYLWRKIRSYLFFRFKKSKKVVYLNRFIFWSIPVIFFASMLYKIDNRGFIGVIGMLWALAIAIYVTSGYLYDNNINIERVTGRFAGLKRTFFRMVKSTPLIGKKRKPFKALRGVSFEIKTGMFGLLGPNGAGKSTLMRIVCGILEQSYGSIWVNGLDTRVYREELQSLIGFLPQEFGTYENMSSWEFLDYQAMLKGLTDNDKRKERVEYVLKSVHMYERKNDKIGSFSGGMKQRIGIALILLHLPRILVVDEPTAGLDPRERIRFRNLLVELSRDRIVIFSTHIIEDIASSCNQVAVVNKGELKYFGDPMNMIHMAVGKVWQFTISKADFEEKLNKQMVVHHILENDLIQVRYLSVEPPFEGAVVVEPNLEDAYLCLLKNMN